MPIRLADLRKERKTVTFPFADDTVTLTYTPGAVTPELEARAFAVDDPKTERYLGGLADLLAEILLEWDLIGDDDQPFKPTRENLGKLSAAFLGATWRAITSDQTVPKEQESSFAAPS